MATKYKNIPVKEDTYAQAQIIAEMHGFGERGLGKLVDAWVARELPDCGHEKKLVAVQIYPSMNKTLTVNEQARSIGYYCPTCRRVYQPVLPKQREEELLAEANAMNDLYGQPVKDEPAGATKKRRQRKVNMPADAILAREG